jgi:hypothetical protein
VPSFMPTGLFFASKTEYELWILLE